MHRFIKLLIALPLLASPVAAQDLFKPLQDMVDTLTNPPVQRPNAPRPKPPEAAAPEAPPVPRPRPPTLPDAPVVATPVAPVAETEPVDPPAEEAAPDEDDAPTGEPVAETPPEPEPERVYQVACPAVIEGLVEAEMAPPLSEGICGEQSPLVVTAVLSRGRMVPLSSPVTTNCQMASALPAWVSTVDGYASSMLDSPLAGVTTGTSYMCRPRNNAADGFTSEHGFANALDVVGFTLEDGRSIAVEANWLPSAAPEGRLLRLAHDAACAGFTTALGPEANDEHADHLHLDLGCHGQTCTAQICE